MSFEFVGAGLAFLISLLIITFIQNPPWLSRDVACNVSTMFATQPPHPLVGWAGGEGVVA